MTKDLIKKIVFGASLLALTACAPQIKYLDNQQTIKEGNKVPNELRVEGLNELRIAPREIKYPNGKLTIKEGYEKTPQEFRIKYFNNLKIYKNKY